MLTLLPGSARHVVVLTLRRWSHLYVECLPEGAHQTASSLESVPCGEQYKVQAQSNPRNEQREEHEQLSAH